jgi:hypothetical protein
MRESREAGCEPAGTRIRNQPSSREFRPHRPETGVSPRWAGATVRWYSGVRRNAPPRMADRAAASWQECSAGVAEWEAYGEVDCWVCAGACSACRPARHRGRVVPSGAHHRVVRARIRGDRVPAVRRDHVALYVRPCGARHQRLLLPRAADVAEPRSARGALRRPLGGEGHQERPHRLRLRRAERRLDSGRTERAAPDGGRLLPGALLPQDRLPVSAPQRGHLPRALGERHSRGPAGVRWRDTDAGRRSRGGPPPRRAAEQLQLAVASRPADRAPGREGREGTPMDPDLGQPEAVRGHKPVHGIRRSLLHGCLHRRDPRSGLRANLAHTQLRRWG